MTSLIVEKLKSDHSEAVSILNQDFSLKMTQVVAENNLKFEQVQKEKIQLSEKINLLIKEHDK